MSSSIEIGRLLRAGTTGFIAGCSVSQFETPAFGALVRAPLGNGYQVYGLIHDIHIDDDGLVRQLVTAENISDEVMRDNRERRIVPVEMSVLSVGYEQDGKISHLLPPRPPLSLDVIYLCDDDDLMRFTSAGRFGYLRHVLRAQDFPISEILAAHVQQASKVHKGDQWKNDVIREMITLLRNDYSTLMGVLGAIGDTAEAEMAQIQRTQIGYLVGGGLRESFQIRLTVSSQEIQEGAFVVIHSGIWNYYGIVTDIKLGATDQLFADEQLDMRLAPELAHALYGQTLYANLEVLPSLMLEVGPDDEKAFFAWEISKNDDRPRPLPVKNIPPHHAKVYLASEGDIAEIFGKDDKGFFEIGTTREQGHPVRLDLNKFVQRSSGIFGATGSGKSFLTRVVLAGLINRTEVSLLVFDMHNEYGYTYSPPEGGNAVPGLKDKLGAKVQIVGLGKGKDAMYQGMAPDINLEIAMRDIHTGDIEMLSHALNLRETTSTTLAALFGRFGQNWFQKFMELESKPKIKDDEGNTFYPEGSIEEWAESAGVHVEAAKALHSRLHKNIYSLPYIVEDVTNDAVKQIVDCLQNGKSVILSFGSHDNDLDYLMVSNILTRRIRDVWEEKTNEYHRTKNRSVLPKPLVIVIEEAHKLLNKEMASQTTFSTIARELRKYYVTLLIIDQRPSQIYDEVMSQLGTRISGWLGDDNDIQAVLSGLSGRDAIKGMLARLQAGQEMLLLGPWGVPMPLPVRSRRYDDAFWKDLLGGGAKRSEAENLKDLGF